MASFVHQTSDVIEGDDAAAEGSSHIDEEANRRCHDHEASVEAGGRQPIVMCFSRERIGNVQIMCENVEWVWIASNDRQAEGSRCGSCSKAYPLLYFSNSRVTPRVI